MASQPTGSNPSPLRIFIFDNSRLRSHLFFRYMSTHPNLFPIYHPYITSVQFGPEYTAQHLRHSGMRRQEMDYVEKNMHGSDTIAENSADLIKAISEAEKAGEIPMANEHACNIFTLEMMLGCLRGQVETVEDLGINPTYLPDEVFESVTPIILIRHPANATNSIYRDALALTKIRPSDEDFQMICSNKELRLLFDLFVKQGRKPIVVDGDDILWRTEEVSRNLCERLGIDPKGLSDVWEPTPKEVVEKMNPWVAMLTKDIHESKGIVRPDKKPEPPSLERTYETWREKYGDEVALSIKEHADALMPHYEYLSQFKA